ncbi:hypothetical protein PLICRDRAFT_180681 [Plicaturopsis crispa FD-325 SS-3]|uniref:Uncharacterized protein n=1 Tax=Plicaturopsis crispa FD-325 SS-3 TaxID=944288 RepID=A0A0C9SPY6_PLICR|nr:hypothetical protein PLICRDRAFT_180681 [Plicaturopsis crispa FD-325 SS-3]
MAKFPVKLSKGLYTNRKSARNDAIDAVRAYFDRRGWLEEEDYKKSYQAWPAPTDIVRAEIRGGFHYSRDENGYNAFGPHITVDFFTAERRLIPACHIFKSP